MTDQRDERESANEALWNAHHGRRRADAVLDMHTTHPCAHCIDIGKRMERTRWEPLREAVADFVEWYDLDAEDTREMREALAATEEPTK